ncbi:MAG: hypothetical protein II774_07040 [Lachnospiraceae bacterium]|nr:hypothetical protein [Lachnospiraceae bacterium]
MYYLAEILTAAATIGSWIHMFRKGGEKLLSKRGLSSLKYYTTLSNLFAGGVSLILLVFALLQGGRGPLPELLSLLKYSSAVSVALTFLVVLVFLGPRMGYGFLFAGEQLFLHAIGPLLAILTFAVSPLLSSFSLKDTFLSVLPTLLYALAYAINLLKNGLGEGEKTNDWYGFAIGGLRSIPVVIPVILTLTWCLALALLKLRGWLS